MYTIIQQNPQKAITFETKTDLASYLGVHWNTIQNRLDKNNPFETDKGTVYKSVEHTKRSRGGNKDDLATKKGKAEGIIPKKSDK